MPDLNANIIAGTLLCQELLVRHLEECGVIEHGSFRAFLEARRPHRDSQKSANV